MIIHFSTVHPRDDSRIHSKEVASLAACFGNVALYVQDGRGSENHDRLGYRIVDTGPRLPRLSRIFRGGWRMFRAIVKARPDVAHFHDPELLPWALLLRFWGIKVVYDVHEDTPQQVRHNPGLPRLAQKALPPFVALAEWIGSRLINGIVAPTRTIQDRFPPDRTVLVRNFPLLEELHIPGALPMNERPIELTYVGYISEVRNIYGMMKAAASLPFPEAKLRLVGSFAIEATERRARAMPEWSAVRFDGWASRDQVAMALSTARAGLVVLHPVGHEMLTLPIKLFEYMAAGVPVIASDFPLWRSIVESARCGLLVNPLDIQSIADAMRWIIENPIEAQEMGRRGRQAVEETYNWSHEAGRLCSFYSTRLGLAKNLAEFPLSP